MNDNIDNIAAVIDFFLSNKSSIHTRRILYIMLVRSCTWNVYETVSQVFVMKYKQLLICRVGM